MSLWPIYVPSKGRAATSKLLHALGDEGVEATFVVEPHEAAAYREVFPELNCIELPESGRGLMYSRNYILDVAKKHEWFWMIDDDISSFHEFVGTKGTRCTAQAALSHAQTEARFGVGQISLEYQQFAWSAGGKVKVNSYNDVCVGIKSKVGVRYRLPMKMDRDFSMQVIAARYETRRVTKFAFSAPSLGSNKGGLHEEYKAGRDADGAKLLTAQWPWCCEVQTKSNGRVDAKIHWKRILQKHALTTRP